MANEKRVRNNNVQGTLSASITSTSTTMTSAGLVNLEAISSTEHAAINIDPGRSAGAPEIVYVTAHTAASTSANILRAQEGTAARAHSTGVTWLHAPTAGVDYLPYRPPSARVRRAAAQAITEGGYEEVSFDTEDWDTDGMWSSTAATKVFANTAGKYLVSVQGALAVSTGGTIRGVGIRKNSTTGNPEWAMIGREPPSATFGQNPAVTGMVLMTTGQYVQLVILHDHSTTLNTATGTDSQPTLSMTWQSS